MFLVILDTDIGTNVDDAVATSFKPDLVTTRRRHFLVIAVSQRLKG